LIAAICALLLSPGCKKKSNTGPSDQDMTLVFSGQFHMTNLARPQRTPHSFTYEVNWKYTWNGSLDQLKAGGNMPFQVVDISGFVNATYRDTADGPDLACSISILADPANPPAFTPSFNASQRVVQISNAEAPTFRNFRTQSANPTCSGGAGVNIFSAPSDWNPLGNGGGTVSVDGGKQDFDKRWQWTHTFAGGEFREYDATIHSTLELQVR
jgi:hypothetical protein